MSIQNEAVQEPSEILDEETKKTLDELEAAGHTVERPDKPAPEPEPAKAEEPAKEEAAKPEEEKKADEDKKPEGDKSKKEPSLMQRWQHEVAEKKWEKEKSQLESKITELTKATSEDKSPAEKAEIADDIQNLATELNFDDEQKENLQKIVDLAVKKATANTPQLPKEVSQLIEKAQAQEAESAFNDDFDKNVAPLVEQEYPNISAAHLQTIRAAMREHASRTELISTPLPLIYKGLDAFRGIVKASSKSIDSSRGGAGRNDSVIDFEEMSEEKYSKLSPQDQERYENFMAEKERNKHKR